MTAMDRPGWAQALVPTDLHILGLDGDDPDATLESLAQADGVDLDNITRCLILLKTHRAVLHCGEPRALMAYIPATGCYAASFDGELDEDLLHLTEPQAGLWLSILSSEQGRLPDHADHWCVISVAGRQLAGADSAAIDTYLAHRDHLDEETPPCPHRGFATPAQRHERQACRVFWALAMRCQQER